MGEVEGGALGPFSYIVRVDDVHKFTKSKKKDVKFEGQTGEIHSILVLKNKTRVFALRNNPHLDGINRFLKEALLDEFYFVEPNGWSRIYT